MRNEIAGNDNNNQTKAATSSTATTSSSSSLLSICTSCGQAIPTSSSSVISSFVSHSGSNNNHNNNNGNCQSISYNSYHINGKDADNSNNNTAIIISGGLAFIPNYRIPQLALTWLTNIFGCYLSIGSGNIVTDVFSDIDVRRTSSPFSSSGNTTAVSISG